MCWSGQLSTKLNCAITGNGRGSIYLCNLSSHWTENLSGEEQAVHTVVSVIVLEPYRLQLTFDDGFTKVVDLRPLLYGPVFEPLLDPQHFAEVNVDPVLGTIVWPNGADLSPEFLYDYEPEPALES